MTEEIAIEKRSDWKSFMRKHWKIVTAFVVAGILVVIGAIYVFLWFTADAQTTGLVPSIIGLWTMGNTVSFILHLIFFELIFIGIPAIIGAVAGWQWWKRLPEQEKSEYQSHLEDAHALQEQGEQYRRCFSLRSPSRSTLTETGMLPSRLTLWTTW